MTYLPAAPMAGYTAEPRTKTLSEQDWLNFLPPLDVAMVQLQTGTFLGSVHHTALGQYGALYFAEATVREALRAFQTCLTSIEREIQERNKTRPAYEYLLPSRIPQSINI